MDSTLLFFKIYLMDGANMETFNKNGRKHKRSHSFIHKKEKRNKHMAHDSELCESVPIYCRGASDQYSKDGIV